jgi:protoheme IX farnesyltransferase
VFMWTPPHFWALSMFVRTDYAAANIPMMPVVAGERKTRYQIFIYAALMGLVAVAPAVLGYAGLIYGVVASVLSAVFVALSAHVGFRKTGTDDAMKPEKRLFAFSILYLFVVFGAIVADSWWKL